MHETMQNTGRRGGQRMRCLKSGHVLLANGNSTLDCVVRNHSNNGVRLLSNETHIIPEIFTLVRNLPDGSQRADVCKVAWRKTDQVGALVLRPATNATHDIRRRRPGVKTLRRYPV